MISHRSFWMGLTSAAALCGALLFNTGCSRGGRVVPATEPVSGTVTLKGKPLAGVEVYFVNEKLVAMGKTDEQGRYSLVQGAVAGENKVYFNKVDQTAAPFAGQEGMDEYQLQMATSSGGKKAGNAKPLIPPEYSNASEPKLNFVVPDGGTDAADFKL